MNTEGLRLDTANRFQKFLLTDEEQTLALKLVPALFLAYLTNKIADYSATLVDTKPEYHADPHQQVQAILAVERLRNFVSAYEELLSEIIDASSPTNADDPANQE